MVENPNNYKPQGYNSVSPYFIVDGAQRFIEFTKELFGARELRRYERPDGSILHAEIQIDDSVLMLGDSSEQFPPNQVVIHVYVSNVDEIYEKAISLGCESLGEPKERDDDPDRRGGFKDFAGNMWSVATQIRD